MKGDNTLTSAQFIGLMALVLSRKQSTYGFLRRTRLAGRLCKQAGSVTIDPLLQRLAMKTLQ